MRRDEVLAKLRAHEAELRATGVKTLYLFGSTARDEARDDSDVDLLFDLGEERGFTLLHQIALQERLAEIVGRDVDLGSVGGLRRWVRESIERDRVRVF